MSRYKRLYFGNSQRWLERAKANDSTSFSKFFYLWASFNALYNLEEGGGDISQIKSLIVKIADRSAQGIISRQNSAFAYFFEQRNPIIDMKEDSIKLTGSWRKKFSTAPSYIKKLKYAALTLYVIRNNLTHGSKTDRGDDLEVVEQANYILEDITTECVKLLVKT